MAMEAELQSLKCAEEEKDREIAALRAHVLRVSTPDKDDTVGRLDAAMDDTASRLAAAVDDVADAVEATEEAEVAAEQAYTILTPAFAQLRRAYAKGCDLPIFGGVARVSLRAADACVNRATKWSSCEHIGEDVDGLLQYVDEQLITPHLRAAKASSLALCEPALRRADPLLAKGSNFFSNWRGVPRGFAEALGRRSMAPVLWLREALRAWYGTPPGRLAMEDKLNRSATAAAAASNGGARRDSNGEIGSTADASQGHGRQ